MTMPTEPAQQPLNAPPAQPQHPAPQQPAPQPAPQPTPPAPAPQPAPQQAPQPTPPANGPRPTDPDMGDGLPYYQEGVPWRQLPPEQQVAYWMHRSRKHEDRVAGMRDYDELRATKQRYDELLSQSQTEHERAVAEARRQGEQTAMARANTMLVEAYVRSAAAARGVDEEAVTDFLETTRLDAFINAGTGQVDTAKVYRQVNRMAGTAATAGQQPGVPGAPAVPAPPVNNQVPQPPAQPGWPQQQPQQPYAGQPQPGQQGQPQQYGQQPVPAAPQWPGQQPVAPAVPGQPGAPVVPDFGQGQFQQAPPSGLEAGRAAARARFGNKTGSSNSQA